MFKINNSGQSIIELLIAVGLIAIVLPAIFGGIMGSREGRVNERKRMEAVALLKEAQDASRSYRDYDWDSFAVNGTFHPREQSNAWILSSGSETINGFTRSIVISDAFRDSNGKLAASGTNDPSTKKLTFTISWTQPSSSIQTVLYLTRHTNLSNSWTTQAQFNATGNLKASTVVANTQGGEVVLGAGGSGDWCEPATSIVSTLDLPGQGITTDISATTGHAYTTTGGNSSGNSMDSVNVTTASPPVATLGSSYNYRKTYGVYATTNYIYLTSDHPSLTVDIVNVANPFTSVGFFKASGGGTGKSVFVTGNTGYVLASNYLYAFDITTINGSSSQPQLGRVALNGTGQRVVIVGNYAYVATNSTSNQLQIIDISNPTSMSVVKNVNMGNSLSGVDVFVSTQTFAYFVTTYASGKSDFFIINISNISNASVVGNYSTNGMNPKGVVAVPSNKAVIVGSNGEQYQVVTISTDGSTISKCGGLTNPNGATSINAVSAVSGTNGSFAYILTNAADKELMIIEGGPGGSNYSPSGTFTSNPFDAGKLSTFNSFNVNFSTSSATTLQFQISVYGNESANCSTANYDFVGWNQTSTTYFATGSAVPLGNLSTNYSNPGRCFRFKAFLTTIDSNQTPVLNDFTINYSP